MHVESCCSTLGPNLSNFILFENIVSVPTLLAMFRPTSNMNRLTMDNVLYSEVPAEVDGMEKQLSHLNLGTTLRLRDMHVLSPACPALKFMFFNPGSGSYFERKILFLLADVQRNLLEVQVRSMIKNSDDFEFERTIFSFNLQSFLCLLRNHFVLCVFRSFYKKCVQF